MFCLKLKGTPLRVQQYQFFPASLFVKVFMRGVCALNFEAMSLLNDPAGWDETDVSGGFRKDVTIAF